MSDSPALGDEEPPVEIECRSPCDGTGYYLSALDVYACPLCGDIAARENIETTSRGVPLLNGGDEEDYVRFVGRLALDEVMEGPCAVIKMPYDAKDDLKELPFRGSERRWSDEVEHWVILDRWRRRAAEHMEERGWGVVDLVDLRETHVDDVEE